MTESPTKVVIDCLTGESQVLPLTAEEISQNEANEMHFAELRARSEAEAQAKAEAKASALAKLKALGLTEEEAKAIAG